MKKAYLILDLLRCSALNLNSTESILASCLSGLIKKKSIQYNDKDYYLADYKYIINYCSIIPDKVDTLRRMYKKFESIGLIEVIKINGHVYFNPSDTLRNWGDVFEHEKKRTTEKNPHKPEFIPFNTEKKTEEAEKKPHLYNNINNNIITEENKKSLLFELDITPDGIKVDKKVCDKINRLLLDVIFPFEDKETKRKFFILCCMPNWRNKTIHAIQMQLSKLSKYDLVFINQLIDNSIMNGWQGLVYKDTDEQYEKWKKQHDGMKFKQIESTEEKQMMLDYLNENW
jgi:hypothetical protein